MQDHLKYSMIIEWSDEDQAFLVILPEWSDRVMMPVTHGDTYNEAVQHAQEVLKMLIQDTLRHARQLPQPKIHARA